MKKFTAYFNYIDGIELTSNVIQFCAHSGDNEPAIIVSMELPEVQRELNIDPEALRKELREYGAWDDEQLADHDENLKRILWIAIWNIADTPEYIEYIDKSY
jgi:hypothetical protein